MYHKSRGFGVFAAAVGLSIATALGAAAAPPSEQAGQKFAVVDVARAIDELNETKTMSADLQKLAKAYSTQINVFRTNPYLPEADLKRLADLTVKQGTPDSLTDPEKADMKRLTDLSKSLYDEMQSLESNKTPTPAQTQRMNELSKLGQDAQGRFEAAGKSMQEDYQKRQRDAQATAVKDVREAVAKVAKKGGYAVVFTTEFAWYCETDITEEVIKQANSDQGKTAPKPGGGKK